MKKISPPRTIILLIFVLAMPIGCKKIETPESDQATPVVDNPVEGWAVLAEKDDYDDVDMTNMLVDFIDITRMRNALENSGWRSDQIHDLREFNRQTLQDELDWLEKSADGNDIVLLFVSAHGKYLSDVIRWSDFFADEWQQIPSQRRVLVVDACHAANFTDTVAGDPSPHLSVAAVSGDELGWRGLEQEGLPIIGGVFTYYFTQALMDPETDSNEDGIISVQEAARMAEAQQRTYMHEVVFGVPEFVEMFHASGGSPEKDPGFPHIVMDDSIGKPLNLTLENNP